MTGPVTTEALRDALARSAIEAKFGPEGVAVIFDPPDEATDHQRAVLAARAEEARRVADFAITGPLVPLLAALQQVTAARDEARATDRESVRKRLIEAHEQLCKIDADGDLPVRARDKNPPDTLRAVAERAVRMLEEIRAEDAAKGRPWWAHTLAKFALDDLVYALAELPDPEAALATATSELAAEREAHAVSARERNLFASELARLRAEGEAKDRALKVLLPFVDYAAGEGLMFRGSDDTDRPDMDAADLCIAAAAALGLELGDPGYCAMVEQGEQEITALARAATAREGA